MRKLNPASLKADFGSSLVALRTFYADASLQLVSDSQHTFLVENTLLAAAVQWEGFVSDLLVAYINRDSSRFAVHLSDALREGLTAKQSAIYDRFASLSVPKHLKKADIEGLADVYGNNITFSNFAALEDKAKSWLVKADADRFRNRTPLQKAVVNALIAVRNHIAHRSDRSLLAMNEAMRSGALQPTGLRRGQNKVHHVGTYLKARVAPTYRPRLDVFLTELAAVAQAF